MCPENGMQGTSIFCAQPHNNKNITPQNQRHIASTMAVAIAPYVHLFYSNFEYVDQEEQSPKNPGTCAQ
jgi:hypothetical protein